MFGAIASVLFHLQWMLSTSAHTARALNREDIGQLKQCLKAWTVYGVVTYLEIPLDMMIGTWLPFYTFAKYSLLYMLMPPSSYAVTLLYDYGLHPVLEPLAEEMNRSGDGGSIWTHVTEQVTIAAGKVMERLPICVQLSICKMDAWIFGLIMKATYTWSRLEFRMREDVTGGENQASISGRGQSQGSNTNVKIELVDTTTDDDEREDEMQLNATPNGSNTTPRRRRASSKNQQSNSTDEDIGLKKTRSSRNVKPK